MANSDREMDYSSLPPLTIEDAEDELVSLARRRAKERLEDGTASNQLIAEVLKHGTVLAKLQREKLKKENELLKAKTEAVKSQKQSEEFYARVLNALHDYAPQIYRSYDEEDSYDSYSD